MEKNKAEKQRKGKLLNHKGRLRELSNSVKRNNICIITIPKKDKW